MGVKFSYIKNCYIKNCDEIMCNTYIPDIGYICHDCKIKFKNYLENNNKFNLTESQIRDELEDFMNTYESDSKYSNKINLDDFFDQYTD